LLFYGPNSIYENKRVLLRAWMVHHVIEVSPGDLQAAKTLLTQPGFDPAVETIVEGDLPDLTLITPPRKLSQSAVRIINYDPSQIEISATTDQPGLLVLSDLYYPGWQVYVDSQPRPLLAVNLAMRGVYLEPGEHTVEFSYQPMWFKWGGISVLG